MSPPLYYFLYAEDDSDDQAHFKEIVERINSQFSVVVCRQGLELMRFLEASHCSTRKPGNYYYIYLP